jgi:hypothetical protein
MLNLYTEGKPFLDSYLKLNIIYPITPTHSLTNVKSKENSVAVGRAVFLTSF